MHTGTAHAPKAGAALEAAQKAARWTIAWVAKADGADELDDGTDVGGAFSCPSAVLRAPERWRPARLRTRNKLRAATRCSSAATRSRSTWTSNGADIGWDREDKDFTGGASLEGHLYRG